MAEPNRALPGYSVRAYQAGAIRVVAGANLGDPIGAAADCSPGDYYRLKPEAKARRLMLCQPGIAGETQAIAAGSEIGLPGDLIRPLGLLTLLAPDGERLAIVTVRHEPTGTRYALPLSPLRPRLDYTLVEAREDAGEVRLADTICVSFAAGTLITIPGGSQRPIETLRQGELILTRDNGPQPVRWVGKATLRAAGSFAPVVISAGTLGNMGELVVSPHHRIFLYQRGQRRLGGTAEVLVQAKHLVDDDRVWRREGGFVDYYCLVFDHHEIIYAEGIPAESLMVNEETVRLLPAELAGELQDRFPGLRQSPHFASEAHRPALDAAGRETLFRKDRR